jgi:hypothetical protein
VLRASKNGLPSSIVLPEHIGNDGNWVQNNIPFFEVAFRLRWRRNGRRCGGGSRESRGVRGRVL